LSRDLSQEGAVSDQRPTTSFLNETTRSTAEQETDPHEDRARSDRSALVDETATNRSVRTHDILQDTYADMASEKMSLRQQFTSRIRKLRRKAGETDLERNKDQSGKEMPPAKDPAERQVWK